MNPIIMLDAQLLSNKRVEYSTRSVDAQGTEVRGYSAARVLRDAVVSTVWV